MKKKIRILSLLATVILFTCLLFVWLNYSPTMVVYRLIHDRSTEIKLAYAFTVALSTNHPDAYDMVDPNLKSQLDQWMSTHQKKKCVNLPELFLAGSETTGLYNVYFECNDAGSGDRISLEIVKLIIRDMKVIGWGYIREED